MKQLHGIFLLPFFALTLSAQAPTWQKEYFATGSLYESFAHRPLSGGYAHFVSLSDPNWQGYYRLLRTDSTGQLLWWKEFTTTGGLMKHNVLLSLPDSGYFCSVYAGNNSYEAMRLTATGSAVWNRRYYCPSSPFSLVAQTSYAVHTADGGFVLSGDVIDVSTLDFAYHLCKTDSAGNVLWSNRYHIFPEKNYHKNLDRCDNDELAIFGHWNDTTVNALGFFPVVVRVAPNGSQLWAKRYWDPNSSYDFGEGKATADNGFILTGTRAMTGDIYLLKLDSVGNVQWGKSYGDATRYMYGRHISELPSGGYAVSASVDTTTILLVTDSTGQLLWAKEYTPIMHYPDVQVTSSGYSLLGLSLDNTHLIHVVTDTNGTSGCNEITLLLQQDTFSLVYFPVGSPQPVPLVSQPILSETLAPNVTAINICSTVGVQEPAEDFSLIVFPVPAISSLQVNSAKTIERLELYDATGKLVRSERPLAYSHRVDASGLGDGLYLMRVETGAEWVVRRVIIGE